MCVGCQTLAVAARPVRHVISWRAHEISIIDPAAWSSPVPTPRGLCCLHGARQQPAGRVRRRQRQARAGLVHQPGQRRPGGRRRGLLDRRLHHHHPGPAPGRQPATDPAGPPARGQGPQDRPDVARPAVHGGVRGCRLPGRGAPGRQGPARGAGHLPRRHGCRDVEGQAGRLPVLVQHAGALVSQVLRRQDRPGHVTAGHLGRDHQDRIGQRRQGRRAGQQVRGLRRVDQRPRRGCRRPDPDRRREGRRRRHHDLGRRRREGGRRGRGARLLQGGTVGPEREQRGHRRLDVRLGRGCLHGQLDLHLPQLRRHRT